jgi:hypothetical protein
MKAGFSIMAMLLIILLFFGKGYYTGVEVTDSVNKLHENFEVATKVLDPLGSTYSPGILGLHISVSHGTITPSEYCKKLVELTEKQKKNLQDYAALIKGKESDLDKELFVRAKVFEIYVEKIRLMCREGKYVEIQRGISENELYLAVQPVVEVVNKILLERFANSGKYQIEVNHSVKMNEKVIYFTFILTVILGIAALRAWRRSIVKRKSKTKKSKTRTASKKIIYK